LATTFAGIHLDITTAIRILAIIITMVAEVGHQIVGMIHAGIASLECIEVILVTATADIEASTRERGSEF